MEHLTSYLQHWIFYPTLNVHRLLLWLLGYLILFAPIAFVSQRQSLPRSLPSPYGIPYKINAFYRYLINSMILYKTLEIKFLILIHLSNGLLNKTLTSVYTPFTPIFIPENTWALRLHFCWFSLPDFFFLLILRKRYFLFRFKYAIIFIIDRTISLTRSLVLAFLPFPTFFLLWENLGNCFWFLS